MTAAQLAALVVQTLDAQQAYFKTRSTQALTTSKGLERRLRQEADAILKPPAPSMLFDLPPPTPSDR